MSRSLAAAGLALLCGLLASCSAPARPRTTQDGVLAILRTVKWGMPQQTVRARFSDKTFVPGISYQGRDGALFVTGYRDRVEGQDVFVGFHFAGTDRLVRVAYSFDVADAGHAEHLYTKYADRFRRQFGVPLIEAASGISTARWKTPHGILIIGTTGKPAFAIQGWDEQHFVAAAKTVQ